MKIYSKTGDQGETNLFSGERLHKCDLRVEAYGTLDELNSNLGVVLSQMGAGYADLRSELELIQIQIFKIGSFLASTSDSPARGQLPPLTEEPIQGLEQAIDRMTAELPPLTSFILPGGHVLAGTTHVARTVCRRAERAIVSVFISPDGQVDPHLPLALQYFNRLADYLFVLARYLNFRNQVPDNTLPK
jgi:cob(I)alamin adenosyltransferase